MIDEPEDTRRQLEIARINRRKKGLSDNFFKDDPVKTSRVIAKLEKEKIRICGK